MKNWAKQIIMGMALMILAIPASGDEIAVTVYNTDLGVIRETRTMTFEKGIGRVAFTDVPARIDATSVTLEMPEGNKAVEILEQNYAFDLVSPDKIYNKYIDHTIDIITEKGELFSGILLSYTGGYLVIKQADGKIRSIVQGTVRDVTFPDLPEGLITRPTLFWMYQANFSGTADAVVGYQTGGIKWQAEYVGVLDEDDKMLDLTGWVSIDNRSGKTYKDAKLKVVAGDIHRIPQARPRYEGAEFMSVDMARPKAAGFEEKPFFEYHLYTLPRPATLANNEIKQISMFEPAQAVVTKEMRYAANPGNKTVKVYIKMRNSEEVGLGMPLPAGRVRVFKADSDKSLILLGEDKIDHTPRNEEVKLTIGEAFDVVGETTEVARRRISDDVFETDYRIEVRNQKDGPVRVVVSRGFGGFWEIIRSTIDFEKKSASLVEWVLDIAGEQKEVIEFTVRNTR
jgi:hypothetical protein